MKANPKLATNPLTYKAAQQRATGQTSYQPQEEVKSFGGGRNLVIQPAKQQPVDNESIWD